MSYSQISTAKSFNLTTKIKWLYFAPMYDNLVFIQVAEQPTTERPFGCDENNNFDFDFDFDFVIDLNNAFGREYYSALLTALTADRTDKNLGSKSKLAEFYNNPSCLAGFSLLSNSCNWF